MKAIRHSAQMRLQKLAPLPLPSAGLRRLPRVRQPQGSGFLGFALWDRLGLRFGRLGNRAHVFWQRRVDGCSRHDRSRRAGLSNSRLLSGACNISIPLRINGCLRRLGFVYTRSSKGGCREACDLLRFLRGNALPIGFAQCLIVGIALLGRLRVNAQLGCTRRRWLLLPN